MKIDEMLKERVEKELNELLECDNWDGTKLYWVYLLTEIMEHIMKMEYETNKGT